MVAALRGSTLTGNTQVFALIYHSAVNTGVTVQWLYTNDTIHVQSSSLEVLLSQCQSVEKRRTCAVLLLHTHFNGRERVY